MEPSNAAMALAHQVALILTLTGMSGVLGLIFGHGWGYERALEAAAQAEAAQAAEAAARRDAERRKVLYFKTPKAS